MAGPVASVVLSKKLNPDEKEWVIATTRTISDRIEGNDFWVKNTLSIGGKYDGEGRPFILAFGFEYEDEQGELAEELTGKTTFYPTNMILFAAMCNSNEDHKILADLCAFVAKQFNGIIDFHSRLHLYTSDNAILCGSGRISAASRDFLTPDFLSLWRSHADFRMVK